jgi:hypothetical protein
LCFSSDAKPGEVGFTEGGIMTGTTRRCSVTGLECRFGLTEIEVPSHCPLRTEPVHVTVWLER